AGAAGAAARMANDNLLLSDRAEVDTRPQLRIDTDEVKASHGATVGRLDEAALFYLRSRGVAEAEARALLIGAFAAEIVGEVAHEPVRRGLWRRLAERLGGPIFEDEEALP
ncbi:MAG: Fe-S cluster assembly protein SufD, partial [Nitrospirae bacterium]